MSTTVIAQRDRLALVAGLSWHPLTAGVKKRRAEIRDLLAGSDATKIAQITSHSNTMIGLYTADDDDAADTDSKTKKPSKLYSVALAFAAMVRDTNAVLAYNIPGSASAVLVVVEGGRPLLDEVKPIDDVQNLAKGYASGSNGFIYSLFTNDLISFVSGENITEEQLWQYATRAAMLEGKPVDVRSLLVLLVSVSLIGGGVYAYHAYDKEQKRKKMLAEQRANDPVRKYESALFERLGNLGMDAAETVRLMKEMGHQPLYQVGWVLKDVRCAVQTLQCQSRWAREGGTTNELIDVRARFGEEILGESRIDESLFKLQLKPAPSGVQNKDALPLSAQSVAQSTPIYQVLANANVHLRVPQEGYKLWPEVGGVSAGALPPGTGVSARAVEFTTSMPLALQAIAALPKNFWWTEVHIQMEEASQSALASMSVTVRGNSYVR